MLRKDVLTVVLLLLLLISLTILQTRERIDVPTVEERSVLTLVSTEKTATKTTNLVDRKLVLPPDSLIEVLLNYLPLSIPAKLSVVNTSIAVAGKPNPWINGTINSDAGITVAVMSERDYEAWKINGRATSFYYGEKSAIHTFEFIPSRDDNYYFVISKSSPSLAEQKVSIMVLLSWEESQKETKQVETRQQFVNIVRTWVFSVDNLSNDRLIAIATIMVLSSKPIRSLAIWIDQAMSRRKGLPVGVG